MCNVIPLYTGSGFRPVVGQFSLLGVPIPERQRWSSYPEVSPLLYQGYQRCTNYSDNTLNISIIDTPETRGCYFYIFILGSLRPSVCNIITYSQKHRGKSKKFWTEHRSSYVSICIVYESRLTNRFRTRSFVPTYLKVVSSPGLDIRRECYSSFRFIST